MPDPVHFDLNRPILPKSAIDEEDRRKGELQRKPAENLPSPPGEDKVALRNDLNDPNPKPQPNPEPATATKTDDNNPDPPTKPHKGIDIRV